MSWFWMNIPAAAVFVAAWCGIPLYMVIKHPSWCSHPADCDESQIVRSAKTAQSVSPAQADLDAMTTASITAEV
jgi:hypothetical protein